MLQLMLLLYLGLVFGAVFLVARLSIAYWAEQDARRLLVGASEKELRDKKQSGMIRAFRPLYLLLTPLASPLRLPHWRAKVNRQLVVSDLKEQITVDEFMAFKGLMTILVLGLTALFLAVAGREAGWLTWLALAVLGFFLPDLWLRQQVAQRAKEIRRALPYVVDLLALSVEGGMDFMQALIRVVRLGLGSALFQELGLMVKEVHLGATRQEAMQSLATRCDVAQLTMLVSVLVQSDRLGVPISEVLRTQARQMRNQRFQDAERLAGQASQKIIFPLILCVMPATMLIIIGPLVIKYFFM